MGFWKKNNKDLTADPEPASIKAVNMEDYKPNPLVSYQPYLNWKERHAFTPETLIHIDVVKQAFWDTVITLPNGHRRMVAKVNRWNGDGNYNTEGQYELFVPDRYDDKFDLVTSLGTDGQHYMLMDADGPLDDLPAYWWSDMVVTPSTSHWHVYSNIYGVTWSGFWQLQEELNPTNEGYKAANKDKGWCGLRPPWILKKGVQTVRHLNPHLYHNLDFEGYEPVPDEPEHDGKVSLAELL